jgi:hypothetical protein
VQAAYMCRAGKHHTVGAPSMIIHSNAALQVVTKLIGDSTTKFMRVTKYICSEEEISQRKLMKVKLK